MKNFPRSNKKKVLHIVVNTMIFATYAKVTLAANKYNGNAKDIVIFVADWVWQFGLFIAFVGSIQFALGFYNDDAHHKVHGIRTVAAGFMVATVSKSLNLFGL